MTTEFARTYETGDPREWVTHVGLYVGNGRMINAQSDGVREVAVFEGYWGAHYAGAGMVLR
jgi:peptidoglycan DL-endopeptidase CwlO